MADYKVYSNLQLAYEQSSAGDNNFVTKKYVMSDNMATATISASATRSDFAGKLVKLDSSGYVDMSLLQRVKISNTIVVDTVVNAYTGENSAAPTWAQLVFGDTQAEAGDMLIINITKKVDSEGTGTEAITGTVLTAAGKLNGTYFWKSATPGTTAAAMQTAGNWVQVITPSGTVTSVVGETGAVTASQIYSAISADYVSTAVTEDETKLITSGAVYDFVTGTSFSVDASVLPAATSSSLGAVSVAATSGLAVDASGALSVNVGTSSATNGLYQDSTYGTLSVPLGDGLIFDTSDNKLKVNFNQVPWLSSIIDTWKSGKAYVVGDYVGYDGKIYRCIKAADTSMTSWSDADGYFTNMNYPFFSESDSYEDDDRVWKDGKLLQAKNDVAAGTFDEDDWLEIEPFSTTDNYESAALVLRNDAVYSASKAWTAIDPFKEDTWKGTWVKESSLPAFTVAYIIEETDRISNEECEAERDEIIADLNTVAGSIASPWTSSKTYTPGTLVSYDGKIYQCIQSQISGSSQTWDDSKFSNLTIYTYDTAKSYTAGDYVWHAGTLYKCKGATTGTFDTVNDKWQAVSAFSDVSNYSQNDLVLYNGIVYKCNVAVDPLDEESLPTDTTHWSVDYADTFTITYLIKKFSDATNQTLTEECTALTNSVNSIYASIVPAWSASNTYKEGDIVNYQETIYRCIDDVDSAVANWDASSAKFTTVAFPVYRSDIAYEDTQFVWHAGKLYRGSTSVAEEFDADKWDEVATFSSSGTYNSGEAVWRNGELYVAEGDDISGSANWNPSEWSSITTNDITLDYIISERAGEAEKFHSIERDNLNSTITSLSDAMIPAWSSSSTYSVGDFVYYQGAIYRCITAVSSPSPTWAASSAKFTNLAFPLYRTDITYFAGLYAWNNGELYLCTATSTSGTFDSSKWYKVTDYDSTKSYAQNSIVWYNGKIYKALTATGEGDWDGDDWTAIATEPITVEYIINEKAEQSESKHTLEKNVIDSTITSLTNSLVSEWASGKTYKVGDLVYHQGKLYRCVYELSSAMLATITTWDLAKSFFTDTAYPIYREDIAYSYGDLVWHNNALYKCNENTSGTFTFSKWTEAAEFDTETAYSPNDIVWKDGKLYITTTSVASGEWNGASWIEIPLNTLTLDYVISERADEAEKKHILESSSLNSKVTTLAGSLVSNWSSDAAYSVGDLVYYQNELYRCITDVDGDDLASIESWGDAEEYFTNLSYPIYRSDISYAVGDFVWDGGKLYKCKVSGSGIPTSDSDTWVEIVDFVASTNYDQGDLILHSGKVYSAKTALTAPAEFAAASWNIVSGSITVDSIISEKADEAENKHTVEKTVIDSNHTTLTGSLVSIWSADSTYAVGDLVYYQNELYRCITAVATSDLGNIDNWDDSSDHFTHLSYPIYRSDISYAAGDLVWNAGKLYLCKVASSGSFVIYNGTTGNWTEVKEIAPNGVYSVDDLIFHNGTDVYSATEYQFGPGLTFNSDKWGNVSEYLTLEGVIAERTKEAENKHTLEKTALNTSITSQFTEVKTKDSYPLLIKDGSGNAIDYTTYSDAAYNGIVSVDTTGTGPVFTIKHGIDSKYVRVVVLDSNGTEIIVAKTYADVSGGGYSVVLSFDAFPTTNGATFTAIISHI